MRVAPVGMSYCSSVVFGGARLLNDRIVFARDFGYAAGWTDWSDTLPSRALDVFDPKTFSYLF